MMRTFLRAHRVALCALSTLVIAAYAAVTGVSLIARSPDVQVPERRTEASPQAVAALPARAGERPSADPLVADNVETLNKAIAFLTNAPGYKAAFHKQEVISGSLRDMRVIDMKLRHEPFSVYLKWQKSREEVLYVAGKNDGKLRVHHVGFKSLLGDLDLAPDSPLAMTESRHPITEVGLLELAKTIHSYRKRDLAGTTGVTLRKLPDESVGGRACECFVAEYPSRELEPVYRKAAYCIDKEWSIPLRFKGYGWPEGSAAATDETTLLEHYEYHDIRFGPLVDFDFDSKNKEYAFR